MGKRVSTFLLTICRQPGIEFLEFTGGLSRIASGGLAAVLSSSSRIQNLWLISGIPAGGRKAHPDNARQSVSQGPGSCPPGLVAKDCQFSAVRLGAMLLN